MSQWQTHSEHPVQRLQAVFLTAPERGQDVRKALGVRGSAGEVKGERIY